MRLNLAVGPSFAKPCSGRLREMHICPIWHASPRVIGNTCLSPQALRDMGTVVQAPHSIRAQQLTGPTLTHGQRRKLPTQ